MVAGRGSAELYAHTAALTDYFRLFKAHIRVVGLDYAVAVDFGALESVLDFVVIFLCLGTALYIAHQGIFVGYFIARDLTICGIRTCSASLSAEW